MRDEARPARVSIDTTTLLAFTKRVESPNQRCRTTDALNLATVVDHRGRRRQSERLTGRWQRQDRGQPNGGDGRQRGAPRSRPQSLEGREALWPASHADGRSPIPSPASRLRGATLASPARAARIARRHSRLPCFIRHNGCDTYNAYIRFRRPPMDLSAFRALPDRPLQPVLAFLELPVSPPSLASGGKLELDGPRESHA